ncbi:uncharacterized protein LOC141883388 isoform X2 [Acropora palmata]|uniref:uncharacterized protein LOC141883388 isoform X2 n=1 Tax=Acropora palmata TaxID=6131 RepID=UPI003DA0D7F1
MYKAILAYRNKRLERRFCQGAMFQLKTIIVFVQGSVLQGTDGRRACHLFHCGGMILLSEKIEGSCVLLVDSRRQGAFSL